MKYEVKLPENIRGDGDDKVTIILTKGLGDEPLAGDTISTSILLTHATEELIEETAKQLLMQYEQVKNAKAQKAENVAELTNKASTLAAAFEGENHIEDSEINLDP